eukprot:evm.model.scf_798EXC.4 EVM.evm.TU.scf_798EXC.4   scf_798EXC:36555-42554(+)
MDVLAQMLVTGYGGSSDVAKSARLVNKHWSRCVVGSLRQLALPYHMPLEQWVVDAIKGRFTRVRRLRLLCWRGAADGELALLQQLPHLTSLDVGFRTPSADGLSRLGTMTNLTDITLDGLPAAREGVGFVPWCALPLLRRLHLNECTITDEAMGDIGQMTGLKELTFWDCDGVGSAQPLPLGMLTGLRALDLRGCMDVVDDDLVDVAEASGLETLILSGCISIEGGCLEHLTGLTGLRRLEMEEGYAASLGHLSSLSTLTFLYLGSRRAGNTQLGCLSPLTALKVLSLDLDVSDEGLAAVANLRCLTRLHVSKFDMVSWLASDFRDMVTDDGLAHLTGLTALRCLDVFASGRVTDGGLASLSAISGLSRLVLGHCACITDRGLACLKDFRGMEVLSVCRAESVTDEGLAHLAELTSLRRLDLEGCVGITDRGVAELGRLTGLEYLGVGRIGSITEGALRALRQREAFANLRIGGRVPAPGARKQGGAAPGMGFVRCLARDLFVGVYCGICAAAAFSIARVWYQRRR